MTVNRYARQVTLLGEMGQEALGRSAVLVVGCGALGSAQAELLARAGVGRLRLVDRDVLELHNLQRQHLYDERDVREGLPKAEAAARRLRQINSEIIVEGVVADVTPSNVEGLLEGVDLAMDGTDNHETRFLLNDAAVRADLPWVYGGVLGTEGTVMAVVPQGGPCLRCVFPDPPEGGVLPTCETTGVLGAAVSWVAALQVAEALKILTGRLESEHQAYSLDVWRGLVRPLPVRRAPDCPCCVGHRFEFLDGARGSSSIALCGRNAVQITPDRPWTPDFEALARDLAVHGPVRRAGLVLEVALPSHRLVVFPDGRLLVMGTTDPAEARAVVARVVGS